MEVVLLSRNSAITGKRVFHSIHHHGLDISRAAFLEGKSPYAYIPAFNASLFLSANESDVSQAIDYGHPAGTVLPSQVVDDHDDPDYRRVLRTAIVTARNAPSHERVITTLEHWGVDANEVFFLGGMKKDRILNVLTPHMFFDDQRSHLESDAGDVPMVHIPFGVSNTAGVE